MFPRQISSKISNLSIITVSLLIFLSIFPLGGVDVWNEAAGVATIFVLSGLNGWTSIPKSELRRLILPVLILGLYSVLQGLATLAFPVYSLIFPVSFDPTASLWCGFKILAFGSFLGLILGFPQRSVRFLTWTLVIAGNFFAVFGVARYLLQPSFPGAFEYLLAPALAPGIGFGTYFNQNHFAFLMLMVFGLNVCLFWYGKFSTGLKILLLAAGLTTWAALILTGSRGGIIGSFAEIVLFVALPLIQILRDRRRGQARTPRSYRLFIGKQAALFIAAVVLLIVGIVYIGQDRVIERFEDIPRQIGGVTNAATFRRTDVWLASLQIIKNFPIFGIGFGGFQYGVSQYIEISGQIVPKQAHNDYLELAASGGIVAVGLTAWFLFNFVALVKKRFAESPDNFSGAARAGAVCGLIGVAFHNFFDFGLQIPANLLFFGALLFVAVHRPPFSNAAEEESAPPTSPFARNAAYLILGLALAAGAAIFGFSRHRLEGLKAENDFDLFAGKALKIPFDADYYAAAAALAATSGKIEAAAAALAKELEYRPRDYELWLKLGEIENRQKRPAQADQAFRRAIELAPFYGKPYFRYGNFLLETNRKPEGLAVLRTATRRNPQYFREVVEQVWKEKGDSAAVLDFLQPLDPAETAKFSEILFQKNEFRLLTDLFCRDADLTDAARDGLVQQLVEKNRFFLAGRVYRRNCEMTAGQMSALEDGNFESGAVREGTGFGWRIRTETESTIFTLDEEAGERKTGLKINFNGRDDSFALLSQFVVVEKSHKYRLNFSYKTSALVTGGIPVVQIILKKPDSATSDELAGEVGLSIKEKEWVRTSIEFATDKSTEAIEIRLGRQPCAEPLCPIFGNLWLDDFELRRLD